VIPEGRCTIVDGDIVPGCYGAATNGALGCYCSPRPRGLLAAIDREVAEWEAGRKAAAAREAELVAEAERLAEAAATWKAGGGVPRVLAGGRA
jgi:hypothetical protein